MPQSVTLYRRNTGDHVNWSDKQQGNQKKQNKNIQQLATQPGSHAGNRDRQRVACAAVQLLSVLSSVQNTDTSPAITSRRTDELAAKERIVYADTLYRGKMVERVINREVMRNSGQNARAEHSPKTQDSSSEQHRASSQRADYPTVQPMPDQVQPADSPLSTTHPLFLPEKAITSSLSGNTAHPDNSGDNFISILSSAANALYETGLRISSYDPFTFPGAYALPIKENKNEDTLKITRKSRHGRRYSLRPFTKRANHRVTKMLQKEGVLGKGKITGEGRLSAVADYLFKGDKGVAGHGKEMEKLAKNILAANGFWGGKEDEQISTAQTESVVREWVFSNVLGMSPMEYIDNRMKADTYPDFYTVSSIHHLLSMNQLLTDKHLHFGKIPPQQMGALNAMWYSFLMEEIPFLKFTDESVKTLELKDYNFAHLYSGSRFLQTNSVNAYTPEEAMNIGEKMWDLAASEGVTVDNLAYYRAPSLFFTRFALSENRKQGNNNVVDAINNYIQHRKEVSEVRKDINEKYNNYLLATKAWLSKGKLADYIISQCHVLSPGLPDLADGIRTREQKREKAVNAARQQYLNGIEKPCKSAPESLNDEYHKLTADTADSFHEVDKYLILSAISTLPEDERNFIQSPDARIHPANAYIQMRQPGSAFATHKHFIERTDLFAVKQEGEERVYALKAEKSNDNGYRLVRVDLDVIQYISSGVLGESFDNYQITWNKIEDSQDIANFHVNINESPFTGNGSHINTITNSISQKHRDDFYDALYEAGNDKSDIQKVWNMVKHIIPFYDCVEGIVNNNPEQAVPSCLMDAVAFIPVFGQAASLSGKFGMGLARGLRSGTVILGKEGIKSAGRNLLREASLPTTAELASLGKNTLKAVDPGFELLTAISRKFGNKILSLLSADKKTAALAQGITSAGLLEKLPKASSVKPVMAKLAGTEVRIPLKKIGKHNEKDIYVFVNPETGELFGERYFINKAGELKPASVSLNKHIEKLKQEGLGGKGSKVATKEWGEPETSIHVSNALQKLITPEMFPTKVGAGKLSAPDSMGLRCDVDGNNYLKVNKNFIKIHYLQSNPDIANRFFIKNDNNKNLYIRFKKDGKFHPETIRERLSVIKKIGLGGHEYAEKRILFSDIGVYDAASGLHKSRQFTIASQGDYNAELLLFPENGISVTQSSLDATLYERAISSLSDNQKKAIRTWTLVDNDHGRYSDGTRNLWAQGQEPINYDINMALRNKLPLNQDEKFVHDNLISALSNKNIPTQKGSYLRTAEYTSRDKVPWDGMIKPGDVVTNSPTFMSVSSSDKYAKEALSWETSTGSDVKAIVIYKIDNAFGAKPLLADAASTLRYEEEYLYLPNSYFKVKGISNAREKNGPLRIGVTLEEVVKPDDISIKNIFTGKEVS